MKIAYCIVEVDFEYNDEIYHPTESEGGQPLTVYSTKEKATEMAKELTKKKALDLINNGELYGYGYSTDEIFSQEVIDKFNLDSDIESIEFSKLSAEDIDELIDSMQFKFYTIITVKVDME